MSASNRRPSAAGQGLFSYSSVFVLKSIPEFLSSLRAGWLFDYLTSSIGKKQLMAATGLAFSFFLCTHLAGNMSILAGPEALNAYAGALHSLGPIVALAEYGLLLFAFIHIGLATLLYFQNLMARPSRYEVRRSAGGTTLGSATMPYTGLYILAFLLIHLINFHLADHEAQTVSEIVAGTLKNPIYMLFYMFSMLVVGLHVSHGFWSAFQTIGANHPKYMGFIKAASVGLALVFAIGYGLLLVVVLVGF